LGWPDYGHPYEQEEMEMDKERKKHQTSFTGKIEGINQSKALPEFCRRRSHVGSVSFISRNLGSSTLRHV
jgi:hypothetical protein